MAKRLTGLKKLGGGLRINVRARKTRPYQTPGLPDILPLVVQGRQLNIPETRIFLALSELKVKFIPQYSILGGDIIGGARFDFYLPEYKIDLEYAGPFHTTNNGQARDSLRNIGPANRGIRIVTLKESDLPILKSVLIKLLGRRG